MTSYIHYTFQVDFYVATLVEGLTLYNRMLVRGHIDDNVYSETLIPMACRSFAVSYAMFPDYFQFYMEQVGLFMYKLDIDISKFMKLYLSSSNNPKCTLICISGNSDL